MKKVTPDWLFERAGIAAFGAVPWGQAVAEGGPGVYVVTSSSPAAGSDQPVVYIGRSKHLRRRLREFYRHRPGNRGPHRGGQDILDLPGLLTVHWAPAAEFERAERIMLEAFRGVVGRWPLGNRMKSASTRRASG